MTVPFFIDYPEPLEVPQDIVFYCDNYSVNVDRDDLSYLDCIYMHLGYYGNDPVKLREYRRSQIQPLFE